jgi:outer membrane protein TolC
MEVRAAFRAVDTAARKVRAAAKQRRLAEGSLDAEERKFMSGQSSNFVIAQRQQDLTDARTNEIGAVIDHEKALVDLWHATGDLLPMRHVQIDVGAAR